VAPESPQGWYPDPKKHAPYRWWDGTRWHPDTSVTNQANPPNSMQQNSEPHDLPLTDPNKATSPAIEAIIPDQKKAEEAGWEGIAREGGSPQIPSSDNTHWTEPSATQTAKERQFLTNPNQPHENTSWTGNPAHTAAAASISNTHTDLPPIDQFNMQEFHPTEKKHALFSAIATRWQTISSPLQISILLSVSAIFLFSINALAFSSSNSAKNNNATSLKNGERALPGNIFASHIPDGDTAEVIRVLNGGTFTARIRNSGDLVTVRFLLVDIPTPDQPKKCYTEETFDFISTLLPNGTIVRLVRAKPNTHPTEQVSAHVYLTDGTWVNARIIKTGHAQVARNTTNSTHLKEFQSFQAKARAERTGLWSTCLKDSSTTPTSTTTTTTLPPTTTTLPTTTTTTTLPTTTTTTTTTLPTTTTTTTLPTTTTTTTLPTTTTSTTMVPPITTVPSSLAGNALPSTTTTTAPPTTTVPISTTTVPITSTTATTIPYALTTDAPPSRTTTTTAPFSTTTVPPTTTFPFSTTTVPPTTTVAGSRSPHTSAAITTRPIT